MLILTGLLPGSFAYAQQGSETTDKSEKFILQKKAPEGLLDGLNVTAVEQTADGFFWLGTDEGLYRYDGHQCLAVWEHAGPNGHLLRGPVIDLVTHDGETLYAALRRTGIAQLNTVDGSLRIQRFSGTEIAAGKTVRRLLHNNAGDIFVQLEESPDLLFLNPDGGYSRLEDSRQLSTLVMNDIVSSLETGNGILHFRLADGRLLAIQREDGSIIPQEQLQLDMRKARWGNSWITKLRDRYLLSLWGVGLFLLDDQLIMEPLSGKGVYTIAADIDKANAIIAVLSDGRVIRISEDLQSVETLAALESSSALTLNSIHCDRSGTSWLLFSEGLYQLYKNPVDVRFSRYAAEGEEAAEFNRPAGQHSVTDMIAATGAGVFLFDSESDSWQKLTADPYSAAIASPDGYIYLGSVQKGFVRMQGGQSQVVRGSLQVNDLDVDDNGHVWLATVGQGIGQYYPETGELRFWNIDTGTGEFSGTFDATAVKVGADQSVWFGSMRSGIVQILPNRRHYRHTGIEDGYTGGRVDDISENPEGELLFSTTDGLLRLDPVTYKTESFNTNNGLPANSVIATAEDNNGFIWLGYADGLYRYDLAAGVAVPVAVRAAAEESGNTILAARSLPDGRLCFIADTGAVFINPVTSSVHSSNLAITRLETSGRGAYQIWNLNSLDSVEVGYENNSFALEFALLVSALPSQTAFRYQMKGLDPAPVVGTGKARAEYVRLEPGEYEFIFSAADSSGNWLPDQVLTVKIIPPLWMRMEFRLGLVIFIVVLIFLVYKIRTNAIKAQRNALQREVDERRIAQGQLLAYQNRLRNLAARMTIAEEAERRRIAGVLHDHIGQALMMSRAKLEKYDHDRNREMDDELKKVSDLIRQAIKETRSLTVEVCPPSLHKFGLDAALESLADNLSEEYGIEIILARNSETSLPRDVAVLLYQSARELIFNVIKHADATMVHIHAENDSTEFNLRVQDDGKGFIVTELTESPEESSGYGLFSIQERMESIGGSMSISSIPGKGTEVSLKVPLNSKELK